MLPDNLDQDVGLLRRGRSLDRRHADTLVAVVEDGVVPGSTRALPLIVHR